MSSRFPLVVVSATVTRPTAREGVLDGARMRKLLRLGRGAARAWLFLGLALLWLACTKVERCARCGMRVDRSSPWVTELRQGSKVVAVFDTPRCGFAAMRAGALGPGELFLHEYYTHAWRPASALELAVGADILGPMGPDFVPVDPATAAVFQRDHHARAMLHLPELTDTLVQDPK